MKHVIDAHCHIYPDGIASRAVASIDKFYDGLPAKHNDGTMSTLLRLGADFGIDHFIVFSVATNPHQVGSINRYIAGAVNAAGGKFTGFGTMHLDSPDLEADLDTLTELGLKGVKVHPDTQDFKIDDPKAMKLYELCEDRGLPINVHTGDYRFDRSNPNRTVNVLKAFPKLKFIGPHMGGWSVWEDALRLLPDFPNITVDTSSCFYTMKPEFAKEIIRAFGSERVMFGTDYPMWPQEKDIEFLNNLGLTEEELENIYWKTCTKLLGLKIN